MPAIASTSGRLHCEFVRLLFLQAHRETGRFLAASGVQLARTNFHFRRTAFSSQLRSKVGRINRGEPIVLNRVGPPAVFFYSPGILGFADPLRLQNSNA